MSAIKRFSAWWEETAPDFLLTPQLPTEVDILIIGAGFAGISTACWLLKLAKKSRRKKLKILLLDKAPYAGFGASGRMNGSIYLGTNKSPTRLIDTLGSETTQGLYTYSNENNTQLQNFIEKGVDCGAEFNGGLRLALSPEDVITLDADRTFLTRNKYYPFYLNRDQLQHMVVSPHARGALFIPGEGIFNPFAFVTKIARLLRSSGVYIVYGARVEQVSDGEVYLDNGHIISSSKVVHTTPELLPSIQPLVVHRREHVIKTDSLVDLDDTPIPLMPVEFNEGLDSARLCNHSILITGGKVGMKEDIDRDVLNDTGFNDHILASLDRTMTRHLPITNHVDASHIWTYIETEGVDGLPIMSEIPQFKGHYANLGHGRNKFGLAFLGAKNIAEKILRIKTSMKEEFKIFDAKRFK